MMAAMASRADCEGPSGFSLESMTTASSACGLRRDAAASKGSVVMRKAAAADAAADRCRKERREKRGMRNLHEEGVYQRASWRKVHFRQFFAEEFFHILARLCSLPDC